MLQLTQDDIYLHQEADNKQEAIKKIAAALADKQFVAEGYVNGMLERESQAATYLGSGIAIPHGTTTTRDLVKKTGVQVFYFPNGVVWGDEGEKAYIAIGIAASSDEHLTLLRQLTHVLGKDGVEEQIKQINSKEDVIALLTGKETSADNAKLSIDDSLFMLDIPADNLTTLQALNASRLKQIGAVDLNFIVNSLDKLPNYLGQGIWINDGVIGNLKNAIAITRTNSEITQSDKPVKLLITIATVNHEAIDNLLNRLAKLAFNHQLDGLISADKERLIEILLNHLPQSTQSELIDDSGDNNQNTLTQDFVVLNANGLHTRPASVLVKLVKGFKSQITVANLDGNNKKVSATSLMKIVAIGAKKGSHLRFTATGEDAQDALDAIGKAIADGFGEGTE